MIDQNERPEEYPSHMVEETADEEEITDHQAVADVLSNGELYEGLTEERLRDVIEEVLEEADQAESTEPHPTQVLMDGLEANEEVVREEQEAQPHTVQDVRDLVTVDLANLPIGVTAEQYITHYQTTGVLLTEATAVDTAYTGPSTSDSTTAEIPARDPLDDLFVNKEEKPTKEDPDAKEEKPSLTPEQIAQMRKENKLAQRIQLKYKRELKLIELVITKDDLVISINSSSKGFFFIEFEGSHSFTSQASTRRSITRRLRQNGSILNTITFDKHGNRLITSYPSTEYKVRRDGTRLYCNQLTTTNVEALECSRYVIVDKNTFLESRGSKWKIKFRQNANYSDIAGKRKYMMDMFNKMDQSIRFLTEAIDQVHPPEDYDIFYHFDGKEDNKNLFDVMLRFRDVTISNSLEMDHYIGDLLVRTAGVQRLSMLRPEESFRIVMLGSLYGMRLSFSPGDAAMKYQHSHLTSGMESFGGFCTGSESYNTDGGGATQIDIQSHIMRIDQFIRWESLEGGPHMKIEGINIHGPERKIYNSSINNSREVGVGYVEFMINEINTTEKKFDVFSDCFEMIANPNGELKFIVDYNMFYRKFMELFPNERIKDIHKSMGERLYTFNPTTHTFHQIGSLDMTDSRKIIKKARAEMQRLIPIYLNGKYLRPHLTTLDANEILQGITFCPEPNFMRELAQTILYKLTDKLEKHGDSSENKGENT